MSSSMDASTRFFTGRQVTTMVVALMATVVLLPSAVWAVDVFTNVAITDPVSGVKAKVDHDRRLNVGDGDGPITVDGTVTAQAPAPFRVFQTSQIAADDTISEGCLSTVPAGRRLVVESVSVFVFVPEGQAVLAALQLRAPGTDAKVADYIVPLSSQGAVLGGVISRDRIAGTEALRAYVEPGESLEVVAIRNQDDLAGELRCTVSGHYVTLP